MTYFQRSGDNFSPTPGRDSVLDALPVGNYIVCESMMGLYFKKVDAFEEPGRMYGNIVRRAERILSTFLDRPRTTGVLLSGEKGSGKSQLARNIARLGYEKDMPTILVNAPFHGDAFNHLLASIEQPAIVIMDEFEKVYGHEEQQEQVLTLLDGMMTSQKLFILTVNNVYRVNDHMKNRPGRIFYSIEFTGLEPEFVQEYCDDNLKDKSQAENVGKVAAMFKAFNFDMLKALVEEMNRYDESAFEAIELLNAKPFTSSSETTYDVVAISPNGTRSRVVETTDIPLGGGRSACGVHLDFESPMDHTSADFKAWADEFDFEYDAEEDTLPVWEQKYFAVDNKNLRKLDVNVGVYEYECDGFKVVYKRKPAAVHNWLDY